MPNFAEQSGAIGAEESPQLVVRDSLERRVFRSSLIDLRREPRWRPDFIDASQLHQEAICRIVKAAAALSLPRR